MVILQKKSHRLEKCVILILSTVKNGDLLEAKCNTGFIKLDISTLHLRNK